MCVVVVVCRSIVGIDRVIGSSEEKVQKSICVSQGAFDLIESCRVRRRTGRRLSDARRNGTKRRLCRSRCQRARHFDRCINDRMACLKRINLPGRQNPAEIKQKPCDRRTAKKKEEEQFVLFLFERNVWVSVSFYGVTHAATDC